MIIFKALVTSGTEHPTYPPDLEAKAIVFVDTNEWALAEGKAEARVRELGWKSLSIKSSIQLSPEPDLSHLAPDLREAYGLAETLGVSLVVYTSGAT